MLCDFFWKNAIFSCHPKFFYTSKTHRMGTAFGGTHDSAKQIREDQLYDRLRRLEDEGTA
jgi:hypothetical protein